MRGAAGFPQTAANPVSSPRAKPLFIPPHASLPVQQAKGQTKWFLRAHAARSRARQMWEGEIKAAAALGSWGRQWPRVISLLGSLGIAVARAKERNPQLLRGGPWGLSWLLTELNQGWMQHVGVAAPGRADGEACRDGDENAPGLRRAQIDGAKSLQLSLLFVYGKL